MGWLKNILGSSAAKEAQLAVLREIQLKFSLFRALLDKHNQTIKSISRLEERLQSRLQIDLQSLRIEFADIQDGVGEIIDKMIELGGSKYAPLRTRFDLIVNDLQNLFPRSRPVERDDFIIPFSALGMERAYSVGAKSANLGEMKSKLGLPVPDGFAISAWAYKHFIETNNLQDRITKLLSQIHIQRYKDLEIVSEEIQELVTTRPIPGDLTGAIYSAFDDLKSRHPNSRFALRSSAMGEDTSFTFAGQYVTFLNVSSERLIERYKQILASKFTPSAIYYLFRHSLSEMDLAMGAVCMELVDSASSGVVYSKDPLNPGGYIVVNAILGLGSYLVEGILTPDVFHVSRDDGKVIYSRIEKKPVKLAVTGDGVAEAPVPEALQEIPSLGEKQLRTLAEYAVKLEEHYGEPQDIEWAMDGAGNLFLIQTRPLKIPRPWPVVPITDEMRSNVLLEGGVTICHGAGAGPAFHISSLADLEKVPSGVVLIAPNPSPTLVTVLHKVKALVTLVGGSASHLATIAREFSLPAIAGIPGAAGIPQDKEITVDATGCKIYDGIFSKWVSIAGAPLGATEEQDATDTTAKDIVQKITHLNQIHPNDPNFTAENCGSLHDIARFIHQKSMEEMFSAFKGTSHKENIGLRLKTKIPLLINIIFLDEESLDNRNGKWVAEDSIESPPMKAFWNGILTEGWPSRPVQSDLKGFIAVVGSNINEGHLPEFSEDSYAFMSREYMLLSLRMGYHFQTIEAMVTPEPGKNYVRMQFKLGGAPLERRMRRIWLICELLRLMGFENISQGDFLDAILAYQSQEDTLRCLTQLGRITILTKQLDITLRNDDMARWYANEFIEKLGLKKAVDGRL